MDECLEPKIQSGEADPADRLQALSREAFGDRAEIRLVSPSDIQLVRRNARYMTKAQRDQLLANVKRDGMLSSVPLCHERGDGSLEVLSGNHRVEIAKAADLDRILVMVLPTLDDERKVAVQLSHNALSGQDDLQILSELWGEVRSLEEQLYSGLDSELVQQLERIEFAGLGAEPLKTKQIVLWFLPPELERLDLLLEECAKLPPGATAYMAPLTQYRALYKAIVAVKNEENVKNTTVAFMVLIDKLAAALAVEKDEVREK